MISRGAYIARAGAETGMLRSAIAPIAYNVRQDTWIADAKAARAMLWKTINTLYDRAAGFVTVGLPFLGFEIGRAHV